MSVARILLVDDQRDITRMLRAALETLGRGYEVVDVPSAEEALLEIRRAPIDLLITDLRLPGITGLELVKRLRNLATQADMIVISAYADERTQNECQRLGATFFPKPLSLDTFLRAVDQSLGGRGHVAAAAPSHAEPAAIAGRLSRLRRDLGAMAVFLLDLDGQVAVRAGDVTDVDLDVVLASLMTAFSASMRVSHLLGATQPANVSFFDGQAYDLYTANVGRHFALAMIFRGDRGAAQMGPVMRYGRQCVDDLLAALKQLGVDAGAQPAPPATPEPALAVPEKSPPARKGTGSLARKGTGSLARKDTGTLARKGKTAPLHSTRAAAPLPAGSQEAAADSQVAAVADLSPDELAALEKAAAKVDAAAASAFWDNAAGTELGEVNPGALSWDQAEKLGLLPSDQKAD